MVVPLSRARLHLQLFEQRPVLELRFPCLIVRSGGAHTQNACTVRLVRELGGQEAESLAVALADEHMVGVAFGWRSLACLERQWERWMSAHRMLGAVALAAVEAEVGGEEAETAGLGADGFVHTVMDQVAGLSAVGKDHDVKVAVDAVAAPDIVALALVEVGWAVVVAHAVIVAASARADHTDSLAVAAFVDSEAQPNDCLPSCSRQQVAVVQGREADFVRVHPIVDLVALLWYQQADMLGDGHLAAAAHRLDLVGHW